jgi:hypothetical protein
VSVDHLPNQWFGADYDERADTYAYKRQSTDAWTPAAKLLEDDRVCYEAQVQNAVDEGYVEVPEDAETKVSTLYIFHSQKKT